MKTAVKIFLLAGALALTACIQEEAGSTTPPDDNDDLLFQNVTNPGSSEDEDEDNAPPEQPETPPLPSLDGNPMFEHIRENPVTLLQLQPLAVGEELAILHTNKGDVVLRFFPTEAPMAVENFTTHARNGFYDGLVFHRVIPGFMIQGGCPNGTGAGGQSIWGGTFGTEPSFNVHHFHGALAMAHAGPGTIGSQFYIVQNQELNQRDASMFNSILEHEMDLPIGEFSDGTRIYVRDLNPPEKFEHFLEHGGTPHLDWMWNDSGGHPVFGHVVYGMDVVDAIANTPRGAGDRPVEEVIIERVSFITYDGSGNYRQ